VRRLEQERDRDAPVTRQRSAEPAPPPRFGTPEWASAVGNAAVARLARARLEQEPAEAAGAAASAVADLPPEEPEPAVAPGAAEAEAGAEALGADLAAEELPEQLPE
jgi:hypothetical protein